MESGCIFPKSMWTRASGECPVQTRVIHAPEELLISPIAYTAAGVWALTAKELLFLKPMTNGQRGSIEAYEISSRKLRSITTSAEYPFGRGLSVSADGQWIAYSRYDRSGSNIMIAEIP
jgi:hypothetical protein